MTAFALVLTKWVKLATCVTLSCASDVTVVFFFGDQLTGPDADGTLVGTTMGFFVFAMLGPMGSVHKSVDGSLFPVKITFPLTKLRILF